MWLFKHKEGESKGNIFAPRGVRGGGELEPTSIEKSRGKSGSLCVFCAVRLWAKLWP